MCSFNSKTKNNNIQNDALLKDRTYILSNISKASEWSSAENISNYLIIKENLQFLKNILQLDALEIQIMRLEKGNNNTKLSGFLTSRQMHCMLLININIQEKNVQGAYHELYDFMESYGKLYAKPIDMVEKIVIRNAIIQIEGILK